MSTPDLDAIQARNTAAINYPGPVTIEQSQADVPALLAYAREQAAKLDAVEQWTAKFEASQSSDIAKRENAQFDLGYSAGRRAAGSILRTALTATDAS